MKHEQPRMIEGMSEGILEYVELAKREEGGAE